MANIDTLQKILSNDLVAKWVNLRDYALDTLYSKSDIADLMDEIDKYGYGEWVYDGTSWGAKGNVPVMTADNAPYGNAIGTAGYSSYARWKAFDGNDTTNGSDWELSSFTAGCYLGYDFVNPICPHKVKIGVRKGYPQYINTTTWIVKGSNDGSTWEDIDSFTTEAGTDADQYGIIECHTFYKQIAVFPQSANWNSTMLIQTLQFYGRELKPLVPVMTSNTTPKGTAIASSELTQSSTTYSAWKGFIYGSDSVYWSPNESQGLNSWIAYNSDTKFKLKMIRMATMPVGSTSEYRIHKVQIYGINNGVETPIGNELTLANGVTLGAFRVFVNSLESSESYEGYKILITEITSNTTYKKYTQIGSIQFYGFDYSEKEFATGSTRKTIYDHGVKPSGAITGGTDDGNNLTLSAVGTATVTIDKGTRTFMGGKAGLHASGTNRLKCGSGYSAFTASNMPDSNGFDISSISGSVAVGIEQTASGTFDCTEIWLE